MKAAATPEARDAVLTAFASKVHLPYMVMAGILVLLGIWVLRSSLPEIKATSANQDVEHAPGTGILHYPHLWLGVLCLFLYVGVEVMAGDAIGTYGQGFGLPLSATRFFTSFTLFAMLLGYLLGLVLIPRFISQQRYLALSAVTGVALTIGAFLTSGYVSVVFVAALGLANAMMWPAIFPLAIRKLGALTEFGSAFLIMGIAGGAVIPQLFAHLKTHYDFQMVFASLMAPCYLYILYYALSGYRAGLRDAA